MTVFHSEEAGATRGEAPPPRLLDQMHGRMRRLGMARRSEEAHLGGHVGLFWPTASVILRRWVLRRSAFPTSLALEGQVSASTQNQALSALLFLYRQVLGVGLPWLDGIEHAKKPQRLPVVLTRAEVAALLGEMTGTHWLMASLLHGTGMRLMERVRLRVKDVDFAGAEITERSGKGGKDRRTMLPRSLIDPLPRKQGSESTFNCSASKSAL